MGQQSLLYSWSKRCGLHMRTLLPDGLSDIFPLPSLFFFFLRDQIMYPLLLMPHADQTAPSPPPSA